MTERRPNRLAGETSPYLLQHAHNPVDWYPWSEEAFAAARTKDRPIFLSVGYAACHWCHVMEFESFEDDSTAALLNERFVSIKVDREERPDVDGIYMDAVQAMTGSGGWPMTVFLTPDGRPFWAGTYFPKEPRHGLPSFQQVLHGVADAWTERRGDVEEQGTRVTASISTAGSLTVSKEPLEGGVELAAFASLSRAYDIENGGFGRAPKFPQPMTLEFVLRMALRGAPDALGMASGTLAAMANGGIHDHVIGGFARYSTDEHWLVPHFEKMLYDNAQLAQLYTHAWLLTREDRWRRVAGSTLGFLLAHLRHPEGGFYSSLDADSEGEEGRFAVWGWDELVGLVGKDEARSLGASPSGNWEGKNVLWLAEGEEPPEGVIAKLAEARDERTPPGVDDKVLTAWNALAIRAFAVAGRAFDEPRYVAAATEAAGFVWERLRRGDGRLLRSWRAGAAATTPGFADDHALLALAYLALYETTSDPVWFGRARELGQTLVGLFADHDRGGFFQTGADQEQLITRPKELYDNAVPSGNSAAAEALLRLALFTGEADMESAGVSALRLVRDAMARAPSAFGHALVALDLYVGPTREVAIVGDPADPSTRALAGVVARDRFVPNVVLAVGHEGDEASPELLRGRTQIDGLPSAYVCERFACLAPVTSPSELGLRLTAS